MIRIQVKSRWATDFNKSFPIKNFNCDFIVLVALNRGIRYRKTAKANARRDPEFYVLPVDIVRKAQKNLAVGILQAYPKWAIMNHTEIDGI